MGIVALAVVKEEPTAFVLEDLVVAVERDEIAPALECIAGYPEGPEIVFEGMQQLAIAVAAAGTRLAVHVS